MNIRPVLGIKLDFILGNEDVIFICLVIRNDLGCLICGTILFFGDEI